MILRFRYRSLKAMALGFAVLSFFFHEVRAQNAPVPSDWHLLDPAADSVQGLGVETAYQTLLKGLPSKTVVVAVIDSGIDTEHEDLAPVIWTNTGEVAGNGIDDDRNGYADDLHGWSFIGSKNGNVHHDTFELTRELVRLDALAGTPASSLSRKQQLDLERHEQVRTEYERKLNEEEGQYRMYKQIYSNLMFSLDTLRDLMGPGEITIERLEALKSEDPVILFAKSAVRRALQSLDGQPIDTMLSSLREGYDYFRVQVEYGLNKSFDPRPVVGDNYSDKRERLYGCADVKGPDAEHGTHVAGIIAGDRKNGIGIRGIADNVRIMVIRAVPDGDERDKDIANAIYYAVDNGASVINMSFGKSLSPDKAIVDEAVRYAGKKGVLIVHAAGNDGEDNDLSSNFPSPDYVGGRSSKLWLEVGASSDGKSSGLVADFSNYGKNTVDVFAPGVNIFSTIPGGYKQNSGTSMASPTVAGVAALLMSYFPGLSPEEVRDILVSSVRRFEGLEVQKPGSGDATSMTSLCRTGGVVSALEAVKLAMKRRPAIPGPR